MVGSRLPGAAAVALARSPSAAPADETCPRSGQCQRYYVHGIYRPTRNSLMRVLNKPFNVVGREAMVGGFYRQVDPLTSRVPNRSPLRAGTTVTIDVPELTGNTVHVRWYVDGSEIERLRGAARVSVDQLGIRRTSTKRHELTARAVDHTRFVRDPDLAPLLRDSRSWTVQLQRPAA